MSEAPTGQVKRFVHQPLAIEHNGYHAKIHENGRVTITAPPEHGSEEYDEVEIPASLVFKLNYALKMTRREEFVPLGSVQANQQKAGQGQNQDGGK